MKYILSIFIFVKVFASCEQLTQESTITTSHLEQQFRAIEDLIKSATCNSDDQCKYLAYGSKACGGPQGYLIYPSSIDQELLESMVTEYTEKEAAYNKQHGIVSDCSLELPPDTVGCEAGTCKIIN